jgi:branched-subunit amino acid aminotransferase/4-amino-4-deoxychorismate lyase
LLPNIKLAGIGELIQAKCAARHEDYDDILLLNHSNHITEASTANFFAFDASGCLRTPDPLRDGCLPGITRQQVLEMAKAQNIPIRQEPLDIREVSDFSGAFLTNAVQGLIPIKQIDASELPWPQATQDSFKTLQNAWL